jgi:hypothetical protein
MKLTAIAAMLLLVAGNATADDELAKWRVGASLTYDDYEGEFAEGTVSDGGTGFKAYAQYRASSWLGLEGAFYVSPEFKDDFTPNDQGGEVEVSYQGFTFEAIGYLPSFSERMDFFVKAGYFNFYDFTAEVVDGSSSSGGADGLALGLGTAIDAGENLGIRLEFDWYDTPDAELWSIGIGAEYRF